MPRTRRKSLFKKIKTNRLPLLFLAAAFLLLLFPTLYKRTSEPQTARRERVGVVTEVSKKEESTQPIKIDSKLFATKEASQNPQRIIIPGYKLDIPIIEARVIDGFWEISETTASHGIGSANPGDNGNIVVFAHARDDLFGPIRNIQNGDEIYLLTKDRWHKFKVEETKLVNPDEVEVVAPTDKETLTLFTCSGFLDSKRLIVKALPAS